MKNLLVSLLLALGAASPAAEPSPAGSYRLTGEQDVASGLRLQSDGRFQYFLIAGALDEQAQGRWTVAEGVVTLVTEPAPVAPAFSPAEPGRTNSAALLVKVNSPAGRGLAGIDLRIGFDEGPPLEAYTQEDGWALPTGEKRVPRWIELVLPMHVFTSPRFPIDLAAGNALDFTLTPNDLGVFDFKGVKVEVAKQALIITRGGGRMRYEKVRE